MHKLELMLFFHQSGRLGNQIFQYLSLMSMCREGEGLIIFGFKDLQEIFDGLQAKIINQDSPRLERAFYYRLYPRLQILSQRKIIATINEDCKLGVVLTENGLLNQIKLVKESYFQSQRFFDSQLANSLKIKPKSLISAQQKLQAIAQGRTPIFAHVRRGDYLGWPNKKQPAVLPASYYLKSIDVINSKINDPFFIFLSDDYWYIKDIFSHLTNSYISQGTALEDFALMSLCQAGILSASTFSWWGSYFAKKSCSEALFLAPKYWAGHRQKEWYPKFIESDFLTYVDV